MKTYDFINSHKDQDVYVTGMGDLYFQADLRPCISHGKFRKCKLLRLTRAGMVLIERENKIYSVPPKNVRLWMDDQMVEIIDGLRMTYET